MITTIIWKNIYKNKYILLVYKYHMEDIRKSKKIFIYKIIDLIPEIVLHIQYHRAFLSVCIYTFSLYYIWSNCRTAFDCYLCLMFVYNVHQIQFNFLLILSFLRRNHQWPSYASIRDENEGLPSFWCKADSHSERSEESVRNVNMNRQVTVRHGMWSKRPGRRMRDCNRTIQWPTRSDRRMEQHRRGLQNTVNGYGGY